jgi:imidazolonepropionase-like amidohydrolase
VDGADDARRAVREQIKAGARSIKLIATGGILTPGIGSTFTAMTAEEIAAAVHEAHKWGRGVAAHAIGEEGILQAVRAGVDSVEHCLQTTPAVVRELTARGAFRGPTIIALRRIAEAPGVPAYAAEKARAIVDEARAGHARAVRGRVRHVVSTDAGTPMNPHGDAAREMLAMIGWGSRPLDVLVAATANGAELLHLEDVGRIAAGMRADLLLVDGDPVDDPSTLLRPRSIWKDGMKV